MVEHATITNMPPIDGLWVPGDVSVTYSCVPGFYLENPDNNAAECGYDFQNVTEDYAGNEVDLVTAIWTGQEKIRCMPGQLDVSQNYFCVTFNRSSQCEIIYCLPLI